MAKTQYKSALIKLVVLIYSLINSPCTPFQSNLTVFSDATCFHVADYHAWLSVFPLEQFIIKVQVPHFQREGDVLRFRNSITCLLLTARTFLNVYGYRVWK